MRSMVTVLVCFAGLTAFAATDPSLTDPPDDALVATSSSASLKIMTAPAHAAVPQALRTTGTAVAGAYYDSTYRTFRPLRLRGDFYIRSAPSAQAQRIAIVRDQALNSKVFLTGRVIDDGRGWVEVIENGREAWISADALIDGRPPGLRVINADVKPQTLGEMFGDGAARPATGPVAPAPAPRPVAPAPPIAHVKPPVIVAPARPVIVAPAPPARPVVVDPPPIVRPPAPIPPPAPAAPPKPQGPLCVTSYKDFARAPRFQKAMPGENPFTHWNGPFGASIDVNSDGSAILHHPIHGDIPLHLSLCLDASEHPYISINGSPMYLQGADYSQVMVTDPTSGGKFQFNQVVN